MSTQNCIVTRSFRGAELFLSSLENQGFVWSADRANALRMEAGEALKVVKRFESWISGDPDSGVVRVLDPKGQALSTGRVVNRVFASRAEMRRHDMNVQARAARIMGDARNVYTLTDGTERGETRMMNADEYEAAQKVARDATDGTWYWVLA